MGLSGDEEAVGASAGIGLSAGGRGSVQFVGTWGPGSPTWALGWLPPQKLPAVAEEVGPPNTVTLSTHIQDWNPFPPESC